MNAPSQHAEFALIDPPGTVTRVDPATRWHDIRVDYERHPAYADLTRVGLGQRVSATAEFLTRAMLLLAKRAVRYEMIPLDHRKPKTPAQAARFAATALRNMFVPGSRPKATAPEARSIADRLERDGCVVVAIDDPRFQPIDAAARPHFDDLAARRHRSHNGKRAFDDSRMTLDQKASPALYAAIEGVLKQSGVFDAASEHLGRQARLVDINPQINDVTDTFWRDIFPDRGPSKLPDTAYYHRDASGGDLKAIIYFSEVGPENGPFNYALGTNALKVSAIDNFVTEANDHNGFSGTDLSARAKFAALPKLFRQKGSYGNDLDDGDPFSRKMVESTWSVVAPKGSIVLFDTKGTHRGGMVEQGERRVVTCVIG
jgi:hypothetical protein